MNTDAGIFKRELLIQRAAEIFAEKGYRATTLDAIAQSLDMTKPALYYYVKNKKQILLEIFDGILNIYLDSVSLIQQKNLAPKERMELLIRSHTSAVLSNQVLTKIFHQEQSELTESEMANIKEKMKRYEGYFIETYREGVALGQFRQVDENIFIKGVLGMINWTYHWYQADGTYSEQEITNMYLAVLLHGYLVDEKR